MGEIRGIKREERGKVFLFYLGKSPARKTSFSTGVKKTKFDFLKNFIISLLPVFLSTIILIQTFPDYLKVRW